MSPERITKREIDDIKRQHILENLLYSPVEAALILNCSVSKIFELVKEGKLIATNESMVKIGKATKGTRITALSLEARKKIITVPTDKWNE